MLRSSSRALIAGSLAAATLTGCYVVPVAPDGTPLHGAAAVAVPVAPAPVYGAPFPSVLQARLYPSNEAATNYEPDLFHMKKSGGNSWYIDAVCSAGVCGAVTFS